MREREKAWKEPGLEPSTRWMLNKWWWWCFCCYCHRKQRIANPAESGAGHDLPENLFIGLVVAWRKSCLSSLNFSGVQKVGSSYWPHTPVVLGWEGWRAQTNKNTTDLGWGQHCPWQAEVLAVPAPSSWGWWPASGCGDWVLPWVFELSLFYPSSSMSTPDLSTTLP
jgi:hypothetical protein